MGWAGLGCVVWAMQAMQPAERVAPAVQAAAGLTALPPAPPRGTGARAGFVRQARTGLGQAGGGPGEVFFWFLVLRSGGGVRVLGLEPAVKSGFCWAGRDSFAAATRLGRAGGCRRAGRGRLKRVGVGEGVGGLMVRSKGGAQRELVGPKVWLLAADASTSRRVTGLLLCKQ